MPALGAKFGYLRDPVFLGSSFLYGLNRWALKPRLHSDFCRFWLADLLLAPCALPVVLWLFRRLGLRPGDEAPTLIEVCWIIATWSVLFEWIGPKVITGATGDVWDVVMYWTGAMAAWAFWNWRGSVPVANADGV